MDIRGYPTGPIDAKGAFTSENRSAAHNQTRSAKHSRRDGPPALRRPAGRRASDLAQ
jgi:hypothetical protein